MYNAVANNIESGILQGRMQKRKKSRLVIIRLKNERGRAKIRKIRKADSSDFSGVYQDMVENLGVEVTKRVHKYYNGQQVTFPMRLYSKKYVLERLKEYDGTNLKALSRELGYSERWLRHLIETTKDEKKSQ
ncbi:Mor transcription activator family protein [Clostridium neonatale]|uniref:Mor transcription activator family protein n=1 Tax=Clostridium neonatale TaxID=137838 RepID=UPI00291B588A|nr:Mor transcription activator family protein [Clostridium neonatale]CAI3565384.1 Mor domain-containing protein [Clostridium neonatale]